MWYGDKKDNSQDSGLLLHKAFVEELIHDLCYGCTIGYNGPQFSHLANNVVSANQQPEVIDTTLEKECEVGHILGFLNPPLPNI